MTTLRRIAPAVGLVFLAPLVAEFLLGNLPITLLFGLVLLAPLYGGGALLIREVTRRAGRGVPTMLALGVAYGLLEEGIATQSLFNPNYGHDLLQAGFVPALGIGMPWTVFVLSLHAIWSTTTPIVLVELASRERRTTPWLGRIGLAVAAVLLLVGIGLNAVIQIERDPFLAAPAQFAGVLAAAAVCVIVGFTLPRRSGLPGAAPSPWLVLAIGLVVGVVLELITLSVPGLLVYLAVLAALVAAGRTWVVRAAWTATHTLAAAASALLTYAWHAFPETPYVPASPAVDLAGNTLFAAGAVVLLWIVLRRVRSAGGQAVLTAGRSGQ